MKRRSELRRAPDEIDNMLESHYATLEKDKPLEQAIEDFKRKPHYADPYEYWKKKQEKRRNESFGLGGIESGRSNKSL